jgi:chemotaxis protein MotA
MLILIGSVVIFACVLGGYVAMDGHLAVLWQPFEAVIIVGAAIGAFIIGNPKPVIGRTLKSFGHAFRGPKYTKDDYLELLSLLYQVFKTAKSKGMLALETHIENPEDSDLFNQFPTFNGRSSCCVFHLRLSPHDQSRHRKSA